MPLPSTMTPIATNTLVSATNSITFSSIPQGYTDLILIHSNISGTTQQLRLTFNGDSGSNYSTTELYGTGSAVSHARRRFQRQQHRLISPLLLLQPALP